MTFVERDPAAIASLRANLEAVGLAESEQTGEATVVQADADRWVKTTASRYDLVLCDPPYDYRRWAALLANLPGDLAVLESGAPIDVGPGWGVLRSKRYGGTIVTVARADGAAQKGAS